MARKKSDANETFEGTSPDDSPALTPILDVYERAAYDAYGHAGGVAPIVYNSIRGVTSDEIRATPHQYSEYLNVALRDYALLVFNRPSTDDTLYDLVMDRVLIYTDTSPRFAQFASAYFDVLGGDGHHFIGYLIREVL